MEIDLNSHYRIAGTRLRLTRAVYDLTEVQAAEAMGCTVETYRKREAGWRWNDVHGTCAFANRFNVNLDWLFGVEPSLVSRAMSYDAGSGSRNAHQGQRSNQVTLKIVP